jgi:hypothetical protein
MPSVAERAGALVGKMLADGPRDASEIRAAAESDKISERTIQRAAIALGVVKTKTGFGAGWTWRLPADDGGSVDPPTVQAASMLRNVMVPARAERWLGLLGQVLGFLKWIPCGLRLSTVLLAEGPSRP